MLACVLLMHMSWPQQKIAFIYISILHPQLLGFPGEKIITHPNNERTLKKGTQTSKGKPN